jgi:hypothetical protein
VCVISVIYDIGDTVCINTFMKGIYGIYKDKTPVYVGQSKNIWRRWADWEEKKYPTPEYTYTVLEHSEDNLFEKEQYWINKLNTLLEGDNERNARRQYKVSLKRQAKGRGYNRHMRFISQFKGLVCPCGIVETHILKWYPHHDAIHSRMMRHGVDSKQWKEAQEMIGESRPVCANCFADIKHALMMNEDIPFHLQI